MCRKCIDLNLICFAVTGENLLIHTRVVWELDIASEKMQNWPWQQQFRIVCHNVLYIRLQQNKALLNCFDIHPHMTDALFHPQVTQVFLRYPHFNPLVPLSPMNASYLIPFKLTPIKLFFPFFITNQVPLLWTLIQFFFFFSLAVTLIEFQVWCFQENWKIQRIADLQPSALKAWALLWFSSVSVSVSLLCPLRVKVLQLTRNYPLQLVRQAVTLTADS